MGSRQHHFSPPFRISLFRFFIYAAWTRKSQPFHVQKHRNRLLLINSFRLFSRIYDLHRKSTSIEQIRKFQSNCKHHLLKKKESIDTGGKMTRTWTVGGKWCRWLGKGRRNLQIPQPAPPFTTHILQGTAGGGNRLPGRPWKGIRCGGIGRERCRRCSNNKRKVNAWNLLTHFPSGFSGLSCRRGDAVICPKTAIFIQRQKVLSLESYHVDGCWVHSNTIFFTKMPSHFSFSCIFLFLFSTSLSLKPT